MLFNVFRPKCVNGFVKKNYSREKIKTKLTSRQDIAGFHEYLGWPSDVQKDLRYYTTNLDSSLNPVSLTGGNWVMPRVAWFM